jgi:hypothetical protein
MSEKGALLLLASLLFVGHLASGATQPEELSSKLAAFVHDYHLTANNFLDGLTHVGSEFQVPMGIEWLNTSEARTSFNLHWNTATVEEIIETIAHTQPGYEVRVSDGVVHISPTEIPREQNFLFINIGSFEVHNGVVEMAEQRLRNTVKRTTIPAKPGPREGIGGSLATNVDSQPISVQLRDASVRDVLDSLARVSAKKIWVVTFVDSLALTATGFRRTLTLWNNSPVPDDEQPVWNMFRWNDPVPWTGLEVR